MKHMKDSNQETLFLQALKLATLPIIISLFLTPIRFMLELAGVPEKFIFIIGLLWLSLAFAIYWGIKLYKHKNRYLLVLLSLAIFSPISRIPVAILWWIDTKWEIGSHYGLYFDNWGQALLNQVVYGALIQIITGFILGSIALAITKYYKKQ